MADACNQETFLDWPLMGPRTVGWCLDFLRRRRTPTDHHLLFRQLAKLQVDQWGVQEYEFLLKLLELAGEYDQLDVSNLAFAEALMRRVQTIGWAYHDKLREVVVGNQKLLDHE